MELPMAGSELDESDIQAVLNVLRSGRLALGPEAEAFGEELAQRVDARFGVAVSSGTAALHIAVRALGWGPGDEVLVPSFTFVASVNALLYEGVTPVFVDIDPRTFCLDPQCVEAALTPRTKGIMVVDVFGHPAPWGELLEIAQRHGLRLIDDSCEALGAEYQGRKLGSLADVSTFAFYPNKQITTGEGGMLVTDDPQIASLARSLRNQGRGEMGAWLEHPRLGFNYRMSELNAALGRSQLARLDRFMALREQVAHMYTQRLAKVEGIKPPVVEPDVRMSWFVYVVTLDEGIQRDEIVRTLKTHGVPSRAYFSPIHRQPCAAQWAPEEGSLPVTEDVAARTLALPFHNRLSEAQVERVASALEEALADRRD
ncbi:MAG: DegT/DnrJ/EryC1/StrS family aminotransferase [Deltaproteobacteria bacterium]|nr:DegT/DnrJ/EryC1/StrS family aminotransferase [Deltaproteobacteria bacterium]